MRIHKLLAVAIGVFYDLCNCSRSHVGEQSDGRLTPTGKVPARQTRAWSGAVGEEASDDRIERAFRVAGPGSGLGAALPSERRELADA